MELVRDLKTILHGEVEADERTLDKYSRDASMFEVRPQVVVYPRHVRDLRRLIEFVHRNKPQDSSLAVTPRSGGTDMSGGALGESIVMDMSRYFNHVWAVSDEGYAVAQPGVFYRDFEKETLARGLILPPYPASREICTVGGMVANNAGGERTLSYGKVEDYVRRLKVMLADGNEYEFRPLSKGELQKELKEESPEGALYRNIYSLIKENYALIQSARPNVSKNSAGYYLWNVWNKETGVFDLTKLIVGSQGTLGVITEIEFQLVRPRPHRKMLVVFLRDMNKLSTLVSAILAHRPESFESYDDKTLWLVFRYIKDFVKLLGIKNIPRIVHDFAPEIGLVFQRGLPKLILLAEFTGEDAGEVSRVTDEAASAVRSLGLQTHIAGSAEEAKKYWTIRHEAFNLIRHHLKKEKSVPFIDDLIVRPEMLPLFLPRLESTLRPYRKYMRYAIGGHSGDGNFHIYSIVDMKDPKVREMIPEVARKVYDIVLELGGSITAEHNDGIIRSPWLKQMYGAEVYVLFERVKDIFDPRGIFNPGKKVGASLEYALEHIKRE
jgi:FAD/FMN-containing dehydrogenase